MLAVLQGEWDGGRRYLVTDWTWLGGSAPYGAAKAVWRFASHRTPYNGNASQGSQITDIDRKLKPCRPKWNAQCLLFGTDPEDSAILFRSVDFGGS